MCGVSDEDISLFFFTTLVSCSEAIDVATRDMFFVLGAEEVQPIEIVIVVQVDRVGGRASNVIA